MNQDNAELARAGRTAARATGKAAKTTGKIGKKVIYIAAGILGTPVLLFFVIIICVVVIISAIGGGGSDTDYELGQGVFTAEVRSYQSAIIDACNEFGLPTAYVTLVQAVMMQESKGLDVDLMQASASGYNTLYPDGITDPRYSIDCGVQVLRDCLQAAGVESPQDFDHIPLALQGYNFGGGYITWALEHYGGYTQQNAVEFSQMQAQQLGWDSYGDVNYVNHVLRYYPYYTTPNSLYIMPLPEGSYTVSDWYGWRTLNGEEQFHKGIDFAAPSGTDVYAAASGWVIWCGSDASGYGTYVIIADESGRENYYCHLTDYTVVRDQYVWQGQVIGHVGSTGDSTGPHLHFEVQDVSGPIDPLDFLPLEKPE